MLGEYGYFVLLMLKDGKLVLIVVIEELFIEYLCYVMFMFWWGRLIVKNELVLVVFDLCVVFGE